MLTKVKPKSYKQLKSQINLSETEAVSKSPSSATTKAQDQMVLEENSTRVSKRVYSNTPKIILQNKNRRKNF